MLQIDALDALQSGGSGVNLVLGVLVVRPIWSSYKIEVQSSTVRLTDQIESFNLVNLGI